MNKEFKKMFPILRQKAEELLKAAPAKNTVAQLSEAEALKLLHELEVYEIELEMQTNEFAIANELYSNNLKLMQEQAIKNIELEMQKEALVEAKLELSETAKQYAEFFDNADTGFFTLSHEGDILELNLYGAQLIGKPKNHLINARFGFFVSESTKLIFNKFIEQIFQNSEKKTCEVELITPEGILSICQLIGIASENSVKCLLTVKDISQQKKFEAAFIADNSRLELAMEAGKIAWWEMETPTGNITCDNRKTAMLGFSPENFTHYTHYTALVHPEDVERTMEAMRQHIYGTAKKYEAEYRIRTASGTYIWTLDMGSITKRDEQGKPLVVAGLVIDITERKLQEAIKGDALHRLQKIASCVPGVVYQYKLRPDGTSCFPFSSEALASIYRVNPKDVIEDASSVFKNIHPDDLEEVTDTIQYSAKNLTQWQHEYRVKFDDGTVRHLFGDSIPQLEEDGSVLWHGYISDITERKLFEQKQRESDQQFRDMFEKNTAVKLVVDPESGSIINANLAAGKFYGYSIKQLENMNIDEINILDFTQIRNKMSIAIDGNSTCFYFQHRLASGEVRDVEVYSGPIQLGGRTVLNSIVHDITVRKRAEEALRLSQEELKRFASHLQHIHEEERVLLAREIHDELAQTLIALKIDMGMLKSKVLKDAENVDANDILIKFDQLFGLVNNTIKTAGSIMTGLRPEALYLLGLVEAISLYVNKFKSKYQIDCQFENSVFEHDINPQQSIALFRILQEALENVAQHAKASKVVIYLSLDKNNLVMVINDNGIGFNKCMHLKSETYGIIGMKERALFVNGIFSITAILGQGTTIKVEIPQL